MWLDVFTVHVRTPHTKLIDHSDLIGCGQTSRVPVSDSETNAGISCHSDGFLNPKILPGVTD